MELSERFLTDYFKMLGMTYDEMIEDIVINNCDKAKLQNINKETGKEKKQGFFEKFFGVKI